jgi:DNA-binding transcriptional regulator YhcF (GntR family)
MKRAPRLDPLPFRLDRPADTPLWVQLSLAIRFAIATGRLRRGARLPSTRCLARQLDVSRNTVATAYEDLAAGEFLAAHTGRGTFVALNVALSPRVRRRFHDVSGNSLTLVS